MSSSASTLQQSFERSSSKVITENRSPVSPQLPRNSLGLTSSGHLYLPSPVGSIYPVPNLPLNSHGLQLEERPLLPHSQPRLLLNVSSSPPNSNQLGDPYPSPRLNRYLSYPQPQHEKPNPVEIGSMLAPFPSTNQYQAPKAHSISTYSASSSGYQQMKVSQPQPFTYPAPAQRYPTASSVSPASDYSIVSPPSTTNQNEANKRKRRKAHEVERLYKCNFESCSKSYGTLNHLNSHIILQNHGQKRMPSEFRDLREELKRKRKIEKARARLTGRGIYRHSPHNYQYDDDSYEYHSEEESQQRSASNESHFNIAPSSIVPPLSHYRKFTRPGPENQFQLRSDHDNHVQLNPSQPHHRYHQYHHQPLFSHHQQQQELQLHDQQYHQQQQQQQQLLQQNQYQHQHQNQHQNQHQPPMYKPYQSQSPSQSLPQHQSRYFYAREQREGYYRGASHLPPLQVKAQHPEPFQQGNLIHYY
ncbi:hypothetical protein CANARDRAFT_5943 [[Candida] arabinofermentans NRRL YB-2248]|uniref:C2H2-type domain-containing protein n=1 Tax=[Candida] arabinofermentans NRRL YB-2248 TaxID=983967 RepID=A0A1E4T6L6_9ASCO|nr:hypothetical protein CANARDRAFT_5943 [[Candida] arabinofermentans NRRL YB-2248]